MIVLSILKKLVILRENLSGTFYKILILNSDPHKSRILYIMYILEVHCVLYFMHRFVNPKFHCTTHSNIKRRIHLCTWRTDILYNLYGLQYSNLLSTGNAAVINCFF